MPAISIIMPCYNAASHLANSIGSVFAQTFADWELIAVDDGSTDATLEQLRALADPRLCIVSQRNQGVSAARNAGLARAQGRYVAFLDADDSWAADFLSQMHAALHARPDAVLAYCGWQKTGVAGAMADPFIPPDYETPDKARLLFSGCRWPIHAALVRRAAVEHAGGFDPHLRNAEDYALWLELAIAAPIVRVAAVLAYYHFHGGAQASANKARAALQFWRAQRSWLARHPQFRAAWRAPLTRRLTHGALLREAYALYWKRDLHGARSLFRVVMRQFYGSLADWKYMLPAWLPLPWHRWLIDRFETQEKNSHG